jgi:hypothetical protein
LALMFAASKSTNPMKANDSGTPSDRSLTGHSMPRKHPGNLIKQSLTLNFYHYAKI